MNWINKLVLAFTTGEITPIDVVEYFIGMGLIIFFIYLGARTNHRSSRWWQ
jgi:hypothetical protein